MSFKAIQSGFSMIEMLLVLGVLSAGLLGLSWIHLHATQTWRASLEIDRALEGSDLAGERLRVAWYEGGKAGSVELPDIAVPEMAGLGSALPHAKLDWTGFSPGWIAIRLQWSGVGAPRFAMTPGRATGTGECFPESPGATRCFQILLSP